MDYTFALGAWAVMVAAPCAASWLVGDLMGAARMRKTLVGEKCEGRSPSSAMALMVEPWRLEGAILPEDRMVSVGQDSIKAKLSCEIQTVKEVGRPDSKERQSVEKALDNEMRRRRRQAFATMPPLAELRAEAEAIRRSESVLMKPLIDAPNSHSSLRQCDPVAERVLQQYSQSIRELMQLDRKSRMEDEKADEGAGVPAEASISDASEAKSNRQVARLTKIVLTQERDDGRA